MGKLVLGCFCLLSSEGEEGERCCCPHHRAPAALSLLGEQKAPVGFLSLPFVCLFSALFFVFLSGFFCFGGACRSLGCDSVLCLFWEEDEEEEEEVVVVFVVGVL